MKIMIRVIQSNDLTANKYIKGIIGVCRFYRLLLGTHITICVALMIAIMKTVINQIRKTITMSMNEYTKFIQLLYRRYTTATKPAFCLDFTLTGDQEAL